MTATIIELSEEVKRRFDEAADKAAREVSALMKEKPLFLTKLPHREDLEVWLKKFRSHLSPEDEKLCSEIMERAERHGLEYEVTLWAFNRRFDEDFELVQCLNEGLLEWDIS